MSFQDEIQKDIEQKESGGDWYKIKEGDNRLRIVAEPSKIVERFKHGVCYDDAPYCKTEALGKDEKLQVRYLTWIFDRADGALKLFKMPYTIAKQVAQYMNDDKDGYGFSGFPMPYDVNIKAAGAGTKEVEYSIIAAKKETPLTESEQAALNTEKSVAEIIESMKQKAKEKYESNLSVPEKMRSIVDEAYKQADDMGINPNDIPFN